MQPALTPLEQQQLNVAGAPSPTFWHHVRFRLVRRVVERTGARAVVDVGAGSGLLGEALRSTDVDYRFTEDSAALRSSLVARFGAAAEHRDGAAIDRSSVVTLLDVIEHVERDDLLLGRLFDAMAPGSVLVVTVPALPALFSSWDADLGHHRRYTRAGAAEVVGDAGFEIEEASYLFPELLPIALLRRWRASDGTAAEFPRLPGWIDRVGRAISTATSTARRWWPAGTSVLVVARRPEAPA